MPIEINQNVKIMFEVKIDGVVVDGSRSNKPFEFTFGVGQVLPALEEKIKDMKAGEAAQFTIPAVEAYGEYKEEAIETLPKKQFAGIENLHVGMQIQAEDEILEKLHQAKAQDALFNPHHKTIKTPEQIQKENLARQQVEALEEQLSSNQQMTPATNPVNMELSQSNDLSLDTISKLANRKKDDGVVEVDLR